jgi:hypothetical protein
MPKLPGMTTGDVLSWTGKHCRPDKHETQVMMLRELLDVNSVLNALPVSEEQAIFTIARAVEDWLHEGFGIPGRIISRDE